MFETRQGFIALSKPASGPDASRALTVFVLIVVILYFGRDVWIPLTLALLLAFLLAPLVDLLRRAHLGRVLSVLLGIGLALGLVLAIGTIIGTQVAELTPKLPRYAATIEAKVSTVRHATLDQLIGLADRIGAGALPGLIATHQGRPEATPSPPGKPPAAAPPVAAPQGPTPWELTRQYISPVLSPFATLGIVFVVAIFALLQREDLRDRLIRLIGADDIHRTTVALDDAGRRLSRYFLTQFSINTSFGVVIGIGLLVIGLPNPMLWAILTAVLRFVPYIGSWVSALLPIALAAAVEPGWSMALWTTVLYVAAESVTGQLIEPMVYGHSTGVSPFSVVAAAIFWSWLWGPVGLILSTPLTLCLVVLGRHVKQLEFLDVMLGDRPALTPVESFYQRILAGDADELLDSAEPLLKDCPLATYYDDIALKGMQLAANDVDRGQLSAAQIESIKRTVHVLVRSLDGQADPPGPSTIPSVTVLSIAGRGPLDEPAAAILEQLLGQRGICSRVVTYGEVSREAIHTLDVAGIAMACVVFLDISGSPAHLRYLVRRLRRQLSPGTVILIGLWPAEDETLKNAATRAEIGADYFVSSFKDIIDACMHVATPSSLTRCSQRDREYRSTEYRTNGNHSPT